MKHVLVIARGELRRIFLSPLAWAVLAVVRLILGCVFIHLLIDSARTRRTVWPTRSNGSRSRTR